MRKHEISDKDRIYHIKEAIEFILFQTAGISEDEFYRNELLKRADVRNLKLQERLLIIFRMIKEALFRNSVTANYYNQA